MLSSALSPGEALHTAAASTSGTRSKLTGILVVTAACLSRKGIGKGTSENDSAPWWRETVHPQIQLLNSGSERAAESNVPVDTEGRGPYKVTEKVHGRSTLTVADDSRVLVDDQRARSSGPFDQPEERGEMQLCRRRISGPPRGGEMM